MNNLLEQYKVRTIFEIECFLNLLLEGSSQIYYTVLEQLKCQLEQTKKCRNLQEQVKKSDEGKKNPDSCYVSSMECDLMDRSQIFFPIEKLHIVVYIEECKLRTF